jgi:glyoxalase family protein
MNINRTQEIIPGIHHITAITNSANVNLKFYTEALGLRLVKKTVNFDDPYTYHFYYGDEPGTPGTILTFFPWENMPRGKQGAGQVTGIAFLIPQHSIDFWTNRLEELRLPFETEKRFDEEVVRFADPHGLSLELVETNRQPNIRPWDRSTIPPQYTIRGFHSATATLNSVTETAMLLTDTLGMQRVASAEKRTRFQMGTADGPGVYYDIVENHDVPGGRMGSGTVHHIAFRARNDAEQKSWQKTIAARGLNVTPIIDRKYFRSIYFRESGGVLFEIATDPPGFLIDEEISKLGEKLMLPERYESRRQEIENRLPDLNATVMQVELSQAV